MSKIEKSDSLFSLGERIWEYKVYLVLGTSFISSLFAPVAAVFGWPATIIMITSLASSSVLLLLSFCKEFCESGKLRSEKKRKDIEFEDKIRCDIITISDKRALGEITKDQAKKMIEARVAFVEEEIKAIKPIMTVLCGGDGEYSKNDYDKFYSLWKNFQPLQTNVANLLLTRAAPKIPTGEISKQTIEFLSSITDGDLEILKRQFRYVLRLPHLDVSQDLGIYNYELNKDDNLQNILLKENDLIHLESCSLRFYGDVWIGENGTRSSYYKIKGSHIIENIDSKQSWNLQIATKAENPKEQQIQFHSYTCLSQIGIEVFNLLKDELESTSPEYLNKLVEYWVKIYPTATFKLVAKTQLLEHDNT